MSLFTDTAEAHGHVSIADCGACPTCSQLAADACADGPEGFIAWFPATKQMAVIRTWDPTRPGDTAWITGCNTGGNIGTTPIDPAVIEASGVKLFTLISGRDVDTALAALGGGPPLWDVPATYTCACCDTPHHIEGRWR